MIWIKERLSEICDKTAVRFTSPLKQGSMHKPISYSPIKRALSRQMGLEADAPATLESEHDLVKAVLAQIEDLADMLPTLPPQVTLDAITLYLREAIPAHCRQEETMLLESGGPKVELMPAMALLQAEHAANDAVAAELAEMLDDCAGLSKAPAPEALGLVARLYFMLMRRHMAWEEFIVAAIAKEIADQS